MIRVMFVCHGNICRSTMAEFLFKDLVEKKGRKNEFLIESAGVSYEEAGNPVHRGTRKILDGLGISYAGKYAVRLEKDDLDKYDYFICMEEKNIRALINRLGGDKDNKISLYVRYTDLKTGEITDRLINKNA